MSSDQEVTIKRYLDLVDSIIISLDRNGRISLINQKAREVLGTSEVDLKGEHWFDRFIPKRARREAKKLQQKLLSEDFPDRKKHVLPILTTEGKELIVSWRKNAIRDKRGDIKGTLISGTIEQEPDNKSCCSGGSNGPKQTYSYLFNSIKDAVFIHDLEGNFLDVNEKAIERLGYTREELLSLRPKDIDAYKYENQVEERIEEILAKGEFTFESAHKTKEGKQIPVQITSSKITYEGKPAILSVAREITQRKEAEARLERVNSLRKSIRKINQLIVRSTELKNLARSSCKILAETRGYMDISVAFKDPQTNLISTNAHSGKEGRKDWEFSWDPASDSGYEIPDCIQEVISRKKRLEIKSTEDYCEGCPYCLHGKDHKTIIEPMVYQEELVGVLSVCLASKRPIDNQELKLLDEVGEDLALGRAKIVSDHKLSAKKSELATIYENAPLIMLLMDKERRIQKANGYLGNFVGSPVEELLGKRGGSALQCIHHLDDPRGCGFGPHCDDCTIRNTLKDTFKTGKSHHQVEANLSIMEGNKSKRELTFLVSTALLEHKNEPLVLVSLEDITERKQADLRTSQEITTFFRSSTIKFMI